MSSRPADIPDCPYCQQPSELVKGDVLYPYRPDLAGQDFFRCAPCAAWVGCHRGTFNPLGRLANGELRRAKQAAHAVFDPLWQAKMRRDKCSKKVARAAAYGWLATQLSVSREDCHIGMMDVAMCHRVVDVCSSIGRKSA